MVPQDVVTTNNVLSFDQQRVNFTRYTSAVMGSCVYGLCRGLCLKRVTSCQAEIINYLSQKNMATPPDLRPGLARQAIIAVKSASRRLAENLSSVSQVRGVVGGCTYWRQDKLWSFELLERRKYARSSRLLLVFVPAWPDRCPRLRRLAN